TNVTRRDRKENSLTENQLGGQDYASSYNLTSFNAECEELQRKVESLGNESQTLREELQIVLEECKKLTAENNSIKIMSSNNTFAVNSQQEELERLCGPEAVASLE
ncbi:hypothetical protein HN873_012811, partial [Arachis hypogaea]